MEFSRFWNGWNDRDVLGGDFDMRARTLVTDVGGVCDRLKAAVHWPSSVSSVVHNFVHAGNLAETGVSKG